MRLYFIVLLTIFSGVACANEQANNSTSRFIEVYGSGEVLSVPDQFSFSLSLEQKGQKAAELNNLINQRTSKLVNALFDLGVEKRSVQSTQVQFNPWFEYNGQKREQKGFALTRTITVTVKDIAIYEKAIDGVLTLGVSQIYGFSSNTSQPQVHYDAALKQALLGAKQTAAEMADTLGLKLGEVISISELTSGNARPAYANVRQLSSSDSFQPGEMSTDAKVKVVFELKND
jgi:hypothetical protein